VLARKPGALRNGAPFQGWELPPGMERVRRRLKGADDGDRQMVAILTAVLSDGIDAVEPPASRRLPRTSARPPSSSTSWPAGASGFVHGGRRPTGNFGVGSEKAGSAATTQGTLPFTWPASA
jgi:hypothetical protein